MVAILDHRGEPIQRSDLAEPQTARIAQLQQHYASHPSRGLTPSRLASILEAAEQGDCIAQFELFEDMEEKDAHIAAEMGKRRRAVSGLEWQVMPPRNPSAREKRNAAQMQELMFEISDFEDVLFDATDAVGKGFAALEIEWHQVEGMWLPKTITHRPQSWFRFHRAYRQEVRLRDNSPEGAPLNPGGWITHVHRAKSGYIERAGLFRVLVWPYLFKNYSVADLAEFLEIYGIPVRLGKYPPNASEAEKTTLLRALVNIGHNAAGIIPSGMEIAFEEAATGDPKAFELMMDWCERSQSKAILGATLTSQADRGSNTNALGNVHNEVREDLRDSDAKQIDSTLTRDLVYTIAALNGLAPDGIRRAPRLMFDVGEPEDLKAFADALPALVNIGVKVKESWVREQLRMPEPEEGDVLLTPAKSASAPAPAVPGMEAVAAASAQLSEVAAPGQHVDPTPVTDQAEALATQASPAWSTVLDRITHLVETAPDLPALREALLASYSELPTDQLGEIMTMALAAAELAGRYDVTRDSGNA